MARHSGFHPGHTRVQFPSALQLALPRREPSRRGGLTSFAGMSAAVITATLLTHWDVTSHGVAVTVRDVRQIDSTYDWLVFNSYGQHLPTTHPVATAAIEAVKAALE